MADAGHELRTPVARLRAELELAQRPGRSRADLVTAIESAGEESLLLARLADDLLLVARAEQGGLTVHTESVAAADLAAMAQRQANAAGIELTLEGTQSTLLGDRRRLEQALGNLIDNAARHGAGPVELAFKHTGESLEIHVRDSGPGFARGFERTAFDRFRRGDAAREGDGAGLGLAIVATIAHAHGGTAQAATRPEGGADVWVRLPAGGSTTLQ